MPEGRQLRFGTVALGALTVLLVLAALGNLAQRIEVVRPDDGIVWVDEGAGVAAARVEPGGAGARVGLRVGDRLVAISGVRIDKPIEVLQVLDRIGPWNRARYNVEREGSRLDVELVVGTAPRRAAIGAFQGVLGCAYLLIGAFVLYRRKRGPMVRHFYAFCLSSFALFALSYTGELDPLDRFVYWADVWATALTPALFVHFCLAFPSGRLSARGRFFVLAAYSGAAALILATHLAAAGMLSIEGTLVGFRENLDRIAYGLMGAEFLAGALWLRYGRSPADPEEAQQRRWLALGALWGSLPFVLFYVLPFVLGRVPGPNHTLSIFALALIPASFLLALARHRLMDVELVFRRGAAYTIATAAILAAFYGAVFALGGAVEHETTGLGPAIWVASVIATALLFQPLRRSIQTFMDRRRLRDRFDSRQTLADFAVELGAENDPERMLQTVQERLVEALGVERLAIFVHTADDKAFEPARSVSVDASGAQLGFLRRPSALEPSTRYLFFANPTWNNERDESARREIADLDLNYYVPCRVQGRTIAWIGLGRTVEGEYLTTEDLALVRAISSNFAIALENARLYRSLEQKAGEYQRLKDYNENIVESLHVGILAVDLDDRVESWNTQLELVFGIAREDAIGRKLSDLLPASLIAQFDAVRAETGVHSIYRYTLEAQEFPEQFRPAPESREGRSARTLNIAIAPLVAKNFDPIGRLIILDDVTERTQLEEQVVQSDKLSSIGLLAAGVAHEVNTPLAVISSYAQMLAKHVGDDPAKAKALEKITTQTFRASEIVNSLLNFSRTAAAELAPVHIDRTLTETLSLVEPQLRKAHVAVETDLEPDLPEVRGVSGKLQQVFLNLILNARDAMPEGGRLSIRAKRGENAEGEEIVRIEVADDGVGIPRDKLARIFDPFFTTKAPKRGTGLGLSVSYGIIKEHAGSLTADSTPGHGATFTIELPAIRKPIHA
ncbi:MAG: ATP-binding protein [Bryobacterales bacterium]